MRDRERERKRERGKGGREKKDSLLERHCA